MEPVKLKIQEFDPNNIETGAICIFIGKRKSGKSYTMRDILYYKKNYPAVKLVCPTEKLNEDFSKIIPKIFVEDEFSNDSMKKLFLRQIDIKKQNKKGSNIDGRIIVIFDDLLASSHLWKKNTYVKKIFMNGRHYNIDFFLSLQYSIGIDPDLRKQADYIFIFRENLMNEREKLYEHYASLIPTFKLFCRILEIVTEDFGCLVIKNVAQTNNWLENIFYYKASPQPKTYRLCSSDAWSFNDLYNESDDENTNKSKNKVRFI